jgi:hypothetical protein
LIGGEAETPVYQVCTAAEYDQYSARPQYTHSGILGNKRSYSKANLLTSIMRGEI